MGNFVTIIKYQGTMNNKTTENAVNTISKIKNRIASDAIKDFEFPALST